MRTLILVALATGLLMAAPGQSTVVLVADEGPVLVVPAPTRAPFTERLAAQACPELVPTTPSGLVRRVAARADEPAPVTRLRRACSQVRSGIAGLLRTRPPAAPGAEALRRSVSGALDRAARTPATPAPWTGGASGCLPPDPTGGRGCVTGATRHGIAAVATAFGPLGGGPTVRSASCWDEHAWNPGSDHPRGRACDLFPGTAGALPGDAERAAGWRVAEFLRRNAESLDVGYLIWQGRYWDPSVADDGGWGRPYRSSVYDTADVTGGHYDHVHVSFAE
ncbi:hypothetical protein [Pseudonocardia xishanensis]|uniref:ARB-07466-like C-terminal domain-containing protein n=1 Tax=Pseudonocardia xishanensis TaxID=630995 RepID=A0ABP8RDZ1_9PSEU